MSRNSCQCENVTKQKSGLECPRVQVTEHCQRANVTSKFQVSSYQKHKHNCHEMLLANCQNKSNFCSTSLGYKLHEPFAYNVLRAGEVFYFGLSLHCLIVKNIAIKLTKFLPKTILQYFYLHQLSASFKAN